VIPLLIWCLVLILIFGTLFYVVDKLLVIPDNFKQLAKIILALIFVLILVDALIGPGYLHYPARLP
jgi:hypothetical protein